jgi:hypothetical protein
MGRPPNWQRLRKTELIDVHKSGPCMDCGHKFPPECMDFDHVRGRKLFNIGNSATRSAKALKREIAKCDLVCSNCHRIRTKKRRHSGT